MVRGTRSVQFTIRKVEKGLSMKNFKTVIAAGSAVIALGMGATGAHAATATADATAQILQQVQISKTGDLNFGTIVPDTAASGVVSVAANAAGTRSCAANLTCAGAASVSSASFNVTGANGQNVGAHFRSREPPGP